MLCISVALGVVGGAWVGGTYSAFEQEEFQLAYGEYRDLREIMREICRGSTHKVGNALCHTGSGECVYCIGDTNLIFSTIDDYRRGQLATDTACGLGAAHTGVCRGCRTGLTASGCCTNVKYSGAQLTLGHTRGIGVGANLIGVTVVRSILLIACSLLRTKISPCSGPGQVILLT